MTGKFPFLSLGSVRAKFLTFASIMHDITERRQAEQEYDLTIPANRRDLINVHR